MKKIIIGIIVGIGALAGGGMFLKTWKVKA